jgi:CubicO group peptidase (beta-lactamase class C family)
VPWRTDAAHGRDHSWHLLARIAQRVPNMIDCHIGLRMLTAVLAALATSCGDVASSGTGGLVTAGINQSMTCRVLADHVRVNDSAIGKVQSYSVTVTEGSKLVLRCSGGDRNADAVQRSVSTGKSPASVAVLTRVDGDRLALDLPVAAHLLGSGDNWPLNEALIAARRLAVHTPAATVQLRDHAQKACGNSLTGTTLQPCVTQVAAVPLSATFDRVPNHGIPDFRVSGHVASRNDRQSREEFFTVTVNAPHDSGIHHYGEFVEASRLPLAGGVGEHAAILQMIKNHGELHGATVLLARSAGTPRTRPIAGRIVRFSPGERSLYPGYTMGFFISQRTLPPRGMDLAFSNPGLLGTTSWIDDDLVYGAVLLIDKDQISGNAMWNALRPLILAALAHP